MHSTQVLRGKMGQPANASSSSSRRRATERRREGGTERRREKNLLHLPGNKQMMSQRKEEEREEEGGRKLRLCPGTPVAAKQAKGGRGKGTTRSDNAPLLKSFGTK